MGIIFLRCAFDDTNIANSGGRCLLKDCHSFWFYAVKKIFACCYFVPFHRRGFDGSSRIQLQLVCFFPCWRTIVNFCRVAAKRGFHCNLSVSCRDTFACLEMFVVTVHCPTDRGGSIYWVYLLFLQVGRITHKCPCVKIRTKTSHSRNQKLKSVSTKSYPRWGHHVILTGPSGQSGDVLEEKCGIIFPFVRR